MGPGCRREMGGDRAMRALASSFQRACRTKTTTGMAGLVIRRPPLVLREPDQNGDWQTLQGAGQA